MTDDPAEREQAAREAAVLRKVGGRAAPSLLDFTAAGPWFDTPVLCTSFVPGGQLDVHDATAAEIELLGSVVAWVHAQPVDDVPELRADAVDLASYADERLRWILGGLPWVRAPLAEPIRARLDRAASTVAQRWAKTRDSEAFHTGDGLALLHGDIAFGNVLRGPEPVLIDWEYARLGDPADEIAYLFDQSRLTDDRRVAFWRGYRGSAHVLDRVAWWEPLTLLGSALWWVERWVRRTEADAAGTADPAVPRPARYYLEHVLPRVDRLDALLDRV